METPDFLVEDVFTNIKVEQTVDNDSMIVTDDENVAVEALQSLSGSHPKQIYCCPHCSILVKTRDELDEHISSNHHEFGPKNSCAICKVTFEKLQDFNNHLICHASSRPYACRLCGSLFVQKQDLDRHLVTHVNHTKFQCKHCVQEFTRMSALTNHMKIHNYQPGRAMVDKIGDTNELEDILTGNDDPDLQSVGQAAQRLVLPSIASINQISMPPAAAWGINYDSENYSGMHLSDINPNLQPLPHLGNMNDEKTNLASIVKRSVQNQSDILRPYKCDKCNKSFAREKAYINHMNNANNHFTCDRCEQCFSSQRELDSHRKYCGNNSPKSSQLTTSSNVNSDYEQEMYDKRHKYVCEVCEKKFATKQKLFRHSWVHRKKLHICEVCSESFEELKSLDDHRKAKHPSGGPYDCEECGKNFCSRQGLWEHGRIHSKDIVQFKCEECDKTFTSRQGFIIHKRKHSDERPYGCKYCTKSFRDGGTLRKHERVHTGERPHTCAVCHKSFNQKVVLREHIRTLHTNPAEANKNGYVSCVLCTTHFAERDELSAHYIKHCDQFAQMAREASRMNISAEENNQAEKGDITSNVIITNPFKRSSTGDADETLKRIKDETEVTVSCDVHINEVGMEIPLMQSSGSSTITDSFFELPNTSQDELKPLPNQCDKKVKKEVVMLDIDDDVVDFECKLCQNLFDSQDDLTNHISVHHM